MANNLFKVLFDFSLDDDTNCDQYEKGRRVLSNDLSGEELSPRKQKVGKLEYVGILEDILKMQKNVCICRHFQRLNKNSALGQLRKARAKLYQDRSLDEEGYDDLWKGTLMEGKKSYLDVWLVDFFSPSLSTDTSDTTSLFILQLACIVNMVPRWKKLKIRVFIIKPTIGVQHDKDDNNMEKNNDDDNKFNEGGNAEKETSGTKIFGV